VFKGLLGFAVAALLSACQSIPADIRDYGTATAPLELQDTPFFPQTAHQCGPAALATLLNASGVAIDYESVSERVYLPARKGSIRTELLAATRTAGRIPYRVPASLRALHVELSAGHPVLVLQNLGVTWAPRWHYAVVIGMNPDNDRVVLRSGTERRRSMRTATFLRTWERSNYWAMIALKPGELPAEPMMTPYFDAVASMEAIGRPNDSKLGWVAALDAWPDNSIALFGLANSELALGNYRSAETALRQLLKNDPNQLMARNNLAHALAMSEKYAEATTEIGAALDLATPGTLLHAVLLQTAGEITEMASR